MNRIMLLISCGLIAAALLFIGRIIIAQGAANVTPVCGAVSSDTTWITSNSPYEVCSGGATVAQGVTLTIQPGVIVQFQSGARLTATGTLMALGTPAQPITFTGVISTPGSWAGILGYSPVITPAQVSLDYVTLEYGGQSGYYGAQVYADHADISVNHSLLRGGAGSGLFHEGDGDLAVHDTSFVNNANDAVRMIQAGRDLSLSDLTATGNGRNVVYIASTTCHIQACPMPSKASSAIPPATR